MSETYKDDVQSVLPNLVNLDGMFAVFQCNVSIATSQLIRKKIYLNNYNLKPVIGNVIDKQTIGIKVTPPPPNPLPGGNGICQEMPDLCQKIS